MAHERVPTEGASAAPPGEDAAPGCSGSEDADSVTLMASGRSSTGPSEEQKRDQKVPTEPSGVRLPEAR